MNKISQYRFLLFILISTFSLSGCLSPVRSPNYKNFILSSVPDKVQTKYKSRKTLMVLRPETVGAYDTNDMAYSIKPYEIGFYAKHRWVETPSKMLQPLLVKTLQRTGHFKAVVAQPYLGNHQYTLKTDVITLLQDFNAQPALLRLEIRNQINRASGNVIATKHFVINVPICNPPYGGVIAANQAMRLYLSQLARFIVNKI